jgi:hypothetical protein
VIVIFTVITCCGLFAWKSFIAGCWYGIKVALLRQQMMQIRGLSHQYSLPQTRREHFFFHHTAFAEGPSEPPAQVLSTIAVVRFVPLSPSVVVGRLLTA